MKICRIIILTLTLILSACHNEVLNIETLEENNIATNTTLTNLIARTSYNNCSNDDFLDQASCFSVLLPVTIIADGVTITIENQAALTQLQQQLSNISSIEFSFPITIIFSNYSQVIIQNEDQLEDFIDDCDINQDNDGIDCVDFQYPISFSIFNSAFSLLDTVVINNDEALYYFIQDLQANNNQIVSLNFPVTLIYQNGETIIVSTNQELAEAIENADANCNYDEPDCSEEEIIDYLTSCPWIAQSNLLNEQEDALLYFNQNGNVSILDSTGNTITIGTWQIQTLEDYLYLNLTIETEYQTLSKSWKIVACELYNNTPQIYLQHQNNTLQLTKNCNNNNPFECFESFDAQIEKCDEDNDGVELFNLNEAFANCTPSADEFTYHTTEADANSGTNAISNTEAFANTTSPQTVYIRVQINNEVEIYPIILKLEDCSEADCSVTVIESYLTNCIWHIVNYNNSDNLMNHDLDFQNNNALVIENNNQTYSGYWEVSETANGTVKINFANVSAPNIQVINGNWYVIECENNSIQLQNSTNDTMVLEKDCDS